VVLGGISSLVLWIWAQQMLRPSYQFNRAIAKSLLIQGLPLMMTSVFIALYFRMDVFFLEYFIGSAAVGAYAAAYRLVEAIPLAATAFVNSLFPVICQLHHQEDKTRLDRLTGSAHKILLAIVAPAVLILTWFSLPVVGLLYAGRFDSSALPLAILSCGQVLVYANILSSTLLVAQNHGHILMYVTMGMVPLNAVLNYQIIPRYGVPGAASTTLATEFAAVICLLVLTNSMRGFLAGLWRVLPPFLLAGIAAWTGQHYLPVGFLLQGAMTLVVYALAILLLRVFDQEEWKHLKKVIR
jgi:O-antigen/teichoic acid export membrane protein